MARYVAVAGLILVVCTLQAGAAVHRILLQEGGAPAPSPGEGGKLFDFGRPCTLVGANGESEITGPNNALCVNCGSGASAKPDPTCTFKPIDCPVGDSINIFYHSSVHHLFLGASACDFATEICANATAEAISATTPCVFPCTTAGSYFISDKAGSGGSDEGGYCRDFGASIPLTVTNPATST